VFSFSEVDLQLSLVGWSAAMNAEVEVICDQKQCPICTQHLPLTEFGICRARKDGRNLYCKSCIRKKVTESRRALKEYKTARKRYISQQVDVAMIYASDGEEARAASPYGCKLTSKLSPVDRVRDAIRRGARTQKEIAQDTKMGKDEIGDALANLLLWTREIRTELVDNTRVYFINESPESAVTEENLQIPRRKRDVPSSFSCLQGLMPGKNPEGEPEKIGGWVAA
jgi:hypothetical protein